MNYLDWKVGDKVVCVDDSPAADGYVTPVKMGRIYCIGGFDTRGKGTPGVYLKDERNPTKRRGFTDSYRASRFRKVQPRKTDISIFTAMLNKTGVDA